MILTYDEFLTFQPEKETFALFGYPIRHTMSPELHDALFAVNHKDCAYIAVEVPPEKLTQAFQLAKEKLSGLNLTIPHKKAVIPLLDQIHKSAEDLGSVNTVNFADGKSVGFNTDILGFAATLVRDNIKLKNKKVLLLGCGGASAVMAYHCLNSGASLTIAARSPEKARILVDKLKEAFPSGRIAVCTFPSIPEEMDIVLNGTPVGMFPNESETPISHLPLKARYLFDAIYNPPCTAFFRLGKTVQGIKVRDGLYMLVMQAAEAQSIWFNTPVVSTAIEQILRRLYGKMCVKRLDDKYHKQNLALCGFMGSGKTTVGKRLAKITGFQFVDADAYLERREGRTIAEIFAKDGEKYFRDLENQCIRELAAGEKQIIALGGGAVLNSENVDILKVSSLLVHLNTPFFRILKNLSWDTSRPLIANKQDGEIRRLYIRRRPIYEKAADFSVRGSRITDIVDKLIKLV